MTRLRGGEEYQYTLWWQPRSDHFGQFIWNKWFRWKVKMSWCEYSAFYNIYLSAGHFSTFYFDIRSKVLKMLCVTSLYFYFIPNITRIGPLLHFHFIIHRPPFYETSPSIIAAIKTKARHFPLIQTLTICLGLDPSEAEPCDKIILENTFCSVTLHNAGIWFDLNIRVNRFQSKTCCKKLKTLLYDGSQLFEY